LKPAIYISGHADKNSNGQMVSPIKTIWLGSYWIDHSGSRKYGLPPAAYSRADAMSDRLNALLNNPWFLVQSAESQMNFVVLVRSAITHFRAMVAPCWTYLS
jgi:hypothetical protein